MDVEFDNVWLGSNGILFDQDALGFLRVGAVSLGEDDDCEMVSKSLL